MTLHAIILTWNEQLHLERCLKSVVNICDTILVVDSGSTDRTEQIAREYGARFLYNPFLNHAAQINFAIQNLKGQGGWLLRLDADEVLLTGGKNICDILSTVSNGVNGLLLRRHIHFMGRQMKWGGMNPVWQLRLWREGFGNCEQRWMDEHIVVRGELKKCALSVHDINLNTLTWWTQKHNQYASREAIEVLQHRHSEKRNPNRSIPGTHQIALKRALKEGVYLRLGAGPRALLYFMYRYILRLGFLDGRRGWYFHVLQGFWYRTLVDAKVLEIERLALQEKIPLAAAIQRATGIDIGADGDGNDHRLLKSGDSPENTLLKTK